ncbi:hypothetical protein HPB48_022299 [Haemaphysalis longicornis]|uniref:CCHC-type domain-containing protein n=1 Tax=Haemaphysalis longicornis TaxID=44386 RepID=A0A9J6F953_HAELO|nr:hypothetical protein HPB48_022299 [Haemaphysalis longicornis]
MTVPNYLMRGISLLRCTLYKRQTDVCYTCGGLGHRADVCHNPNKRVRRGCGIASPPEDHPCSPRCAPCGGPHPTATECAKDAFKFLTSCDGEDGTEIASKRLSNSWPRRAGHVIPGHQCSQEGALRYTIWPPTRQFQGALSLQGADLGRVYLGGSGQAEASGSATKGNAGSIARAYGRPRGC